MALLVGAVTLFVSGLLELRGGSAATGNLGAGRRRLGPGVAPGPLTSGRTEVPTVSPPAH